MFEIEDCQNCELHKTAKMRSRCLKGEGGVGAKLAIYVDHPGFMDDRQTRPFASDAGQLLKWMLRRMSIPPEQVYLDYIVKCYPGKKMTGKKPQRLSYIQQCDRYRIATLQMVFPREIIGFGGLCLEAFCGHAMQNIGNFANAFWPPRDPRIAQMVNRVWIGYSAGYPVAPGAAGEAQNQFGLLWMAAEAAGLKPVINEDVRPFKFEI